MEFFLIYFDISKHSFYRREVLMFIAEYSFKGLRNIPFWAIGSYLIGMYYEVTFW